MHRVKLLGVPPSSAGTVGEEQGKRPLSRGAFKTTHLSLLLNNDNALKMHSLPNLLPLVKCSQLWGRSGRAGGRGVRQGLILSSHAFRSWAHPRAL